MILFSRLFIDISLALDTQGVRGRSNAASYQVLDRLRHDDLIILITLSAGRVVRDGMCKLKPTLVLLRQHDMPCGFRGKNLSRV